MRYYVSWKTTGYYRKDSLKLAARCSVSGCRSSCSASTARPGIAKEISGERLLERNVLQAVCPLTSVITALKAMLPLLYKLILNCYIIDELRTTLHKYQRHASQFWREKNSSSKSVLKLFQNDSCLHQSLLTPRKTSSQNSFQVRLSRCKSSNE